MKTYFELGILSKNKKKTYETITKDNSYDLFMLSRYFFDIYTLENLKKNNIKEHLKNIHELNDIQLNFFTFLFLTNKKIKNFYEHGYTLFEKIYYMKFFSKVLEKKLNFNINWIGYDISSLFNFFCKNFYKNFKIILKNKINFKKINNSVFFFKRYHSTL